MEHDISQTERVGNNNSIENIIYRVFNGRLSRGNYWLGTFILNLAVLDAYLIAYIMGVYELNPIKVLSDAKLTSYNDMLLLWFKITPLVILTACYFIISGSLITRRLHDLGRNFAGASGGYFWSYILFLRSGENKTNQFGRPQTSISLLNLIGME